VTETIDMVPFELRAEAWLLVLGLAVGYQWAVRNLGPRLSGFDAEEVAGRRRLFMAGLMVLAISVSWPIDTIGDGYLFSIHMLQYLLMSFVSAPLLVAGTPGWMLTTLTQPIDPLVRRLARPVVAVALFNVVGVYLRVDAVHFGMHALWMVAGYVFWLPVLNRAPEHYGKLSPPLQMVYLFLSSIIPTVPASFLTWSQTGLFDEYSAAPRLWGVTAAQDTQAAGAIMKLGGGLFLWGLIVVIFFRWAATQSQPAPRRAPSSEPVST
jgi:putative membrane protein